MDYSAKIIKTPDGRANQLRIIANARFPVSELAERAIQSHVPNRPDVTLKQLARESIEGFEEAVILVRKWMP